MNVTGNVTDSCAVAVPAHTPGPWRVNEMGGFSKIVSGNDDTNGVIIYNTNGNDADGRFDDEATRHLHRERSANARLIAAAPDMLAFAKAHDAYMLDAGYEGPESSALHPKAAENWHACRSVIAKAEGRS